MSWSPWLDVGFVTIVCVCAVCFAIYLALWVLRRDTGTEEMHAVSDPIKRGAEGFFRTQYTTIAAFAVPVAVCVFVLYVVRSSKKEDVNIPKVVHAVIISGSFLIGAFLSGVSGLVAMWFAVRANVRVASAATRNYNESVKIALRGGAFSGVFVVSLSVVGVALLYGLLYGIFSSTDRELSISKIPLLLVGYGFGASFVALFAQLGGGIYTKAADVGADLVGKVQAGIPEDDPRNPAVIADLVGDNVGDTAGRAADLFESIAAENIGAMIIASTLGQNAIPRMDRPVAYVMFPLVLNAFGMIGSAIAILSCRCRSKKRTKVGHELMAEEEGIALHEHEDPLSALRRSFAICVLLSGVGVVCASAWLLSTSTSTTAWWKFSLCGLIGVLLGWAFVFVTVYYTDSGRGPVRRIARASETGAGTNVITGLAVGLESTCLPILMISLAICGSYWIGRYAGFEDELGVKNGGLFGTAVATMGMLSVSVYVLAMDTFGPIADNAGGIVEMSNQSSAAREVTDRLDAVGNTTAALTKGYAIGSAALAAFLLFTAFTDEMTQYAGEDYHVVDISVPEVFVGGLIGAGLVFLFSSLAMRAVGSCAGTIIREVQRQFEEYPGIMDGTALPDYDRCVAIVARSAIRHMVLPGLLPTAVPLLVGFTFRFIGRAMGMGDLGVRVVAGLLIVGTIAGILMALFLNNGGGAFDNAKKYIESGHCGG